MAVTAVTSTRASFASRRQKEAPTSPTTWSLLPRPVIAHIHAAHKRVPLTGGLYTPCTRGYHTANLVRLGGKESMIVFGGLHNHGPTTKLEIYDVESNVWRKGDARGEEPSRRFGHTATVVYPNTLAPPLLPLQQILEDESKIDIIVTGGSDGSYLIRNGRELRTILVLSIDNTTTGSKEKEGSYTMSWSMRRLNSLDGCREGSSHPPWTPLRPSLALACCVLARCGASSRGQSLRSLPAFAVEPAPRPLHPRSRPSRPGCVTAVCGV